MKTIKDLPEHSRPREKGAAALSDVELVAAILGMGTAGIDVRTMARPVADLIRQHKAALRLDHLQSICVPESRKVIRDQRAKETLASWSALYRTGRLQSAKQPV